MEISGIHALTSAQEMRLTNYLEDKYLFILRDFRKRHEPNSTLPTLPDYLKAMRPLIFDMIMLIPPLSPSGELRTSLLLRFTSELLSSVVCYPSFVPLGGQPSANSDDDDEGDASNSGGSGGSLSSSVRMDEDEASQASAERRYPLVELFELLTDLDYAWSTVLCCQVWDSETKRGKDVILEMTNPDDDVKMEGSQSDVQTEDNEIKLYAPSMTDCTRLRSMIVSGIDGIESWLAEADAPEAALETFENCFSLTLRLLGEDSNQVVWQEHQVDGQEV
ncbi:hypothetical protein CPB86DRAFT_774902 [Serendipita vermifera]|nr:hypothetical protein CPB86DRAFT_774902 [Serendipita vermifera]